MPRLRTIHLAILLFALPGTLAAAEKIDFVRDVRPIFEKHCYACHGPERQRSSFRLDVKSVALEGGEAYAPNVVPGQPAESPLFQFVTEAEEGMLMPPEGPRLAAREIATLKSWIEQGAIWPDGVDTVQLRDRTLHWSLQPVQAHALPQVQQTDWPQNGVDNWVLARLESAGLAPSPPADRRTWLRRTYLNLIGLPPSPAEIAAFLADSSPQAREQVVEELLNSPRYGERWAQHWLDVVRYADTHGFEVNTPRPNAWPYRDYVITAFNNDTPYDRFILEQLCGDKFKSDAATGFLVAAAALLPGQIGKDEESKRLARQDELDEIIVGTSGALLGLTIGCARCHDHKFDPITQRDYYSLQAFFAGVDYGDRPLRAGRGSLKSLAGDDESDEDGGRPMVFGGRFHKPGKTQLLRRGDPEQPIEEVQPAVPAVFNFALPDMKLTEQQRRLSLARWIASPKNPLTARVMVNRLWQHHFGVGIVASPNDFGWKGSPPSHPELLDWLAAEFVSSGWSIKHMQRLIVLSATYGQSSQVRPAATAIDRDNRLLWRYAPRRVEAEVIRDAMLLVSGELNLTMGGPGFDFFKSRGGLTGFPPVEKFESAGLRRMIYAHKVRMEKVPVFGAFDCPDAGQSMPLRSQSTTAIQALNLFNSEFVAQRAQAMAQRVQQETGNDVAAQVAAAFELSLGRTPLPEEAQAAEQVVQEHGLAPLCRVLFNSNEFLFVP